MSVKNIMGRSALVLLPISWMTFVLFVFFYMFGLYTQDVLRALGVFILLSYFLYSSIPDGKIKKIQQKINCIFFDFFAWIFRNPYKSGLILFFIIFLCYGLVGFYISGFGYDHGYFLQALSNPYENGLFQFTTFYDFFSFFKHHFEPFLFLLYPIKFLPFSNVFLCSVAYFALALTFVIGIRFVNQETQLTLNQKITLLLTCLSTPFWYGLEFFEFHELALVPLFYLLIFISWYNKSLLKIAIFTIMALTLKETVSVTFIFSGLLLMVFGKSFDKKAGLVVFGLGLTVYLFYFKFIMLNLSGRGESFYVFHYSHLGSSMVDITLAPILNTKAWLLSLFQFKNLNYLFLILLPIVFYILKGWKALLFAFPVVYTSIISNYEGLLYYRFQYGGELVIPICVCAFYGIKYYSTRHSFKNIYLIFSVVVFLNFLYINPFEGVKNLIKNKDGIPFAYELQKIPSQYVVMTNTDQVFPFIAKRKYMYSTEEWKQGFSKQQLESVDYFVYKTYEKSRLYLPESAKLIASYKEFSLYKAK